MCLEINPFRLKQSLCHCHRVLVVFLFFPLFPLHYHPTLRPFHRFNKQKTVSDRLHTTQGNSISLIPVRAPSISVTALMKDNDRIAAVLPLSSYRFCFKTKRIQQNALTTNRSTHFTYLWWPVCQSSARCIRHAAARGDLFILRWWPAFLVEPTSCPFVFDGGSPNGDWCKF